MNGIRGPALNGGVVSDRYAAKSFPLNDTGVFNAFPNRFGRLNLFRSGQCLIIDTRYLHIDINVIQQQT